MERLRAGLNASEWVGWSYVFYPVTPGTSGRCRGGKERPARPPPASSHEPHVLDSAPAAARGPQVSAARLPFPEEGVAARPGSCPAGWGARKLEGEPEGGVVTWANLPQGNEVSSRLLGGDGGGRIRPRLTQAGRGISPCSLQPSPLPPPPPGRSREPARCGGSRPAPCLPQRLGFLSVPASLPPPRRPASRNRPPRGGAEGRGGCHPMGSRRAAKRRGSRGRRRARRAHLTAEPVRRGPRLRELRRRAQPAGRGHPRAQPPAPPTPPTSQAQKGARRGRPSLCPRGSGAPGRLPSGCSYTTAAAGAGRCTWPGLGPQRRGPVRGRETEARDAVCPPGRPGPWRRCVRSARRAGVGGGARPRRCPRIAASTRVAEPPLGARCRETGDTQHRFCSRMDGSLWEEGSLGQLCRGHWLVEKK